MTTRKQIISEVKFSILVLVSFVLLFFLLLTTTIATNTGSSGNANLTVWDDTDTGGVTKYSNSNVTFFANFTNTTNYLINSTEGNCTVRFNYTGSYGNSFNMTFNSSRLLWIYTATINYKGTHNFQANCTSSYGNVTVADTFLISNTEPSISKDPGGFINLDGNTETTDYWYCTEDVLCTYNFSTNVTEIDANDVLTFGYGANTTLTNYTLNTSTGILQINYTNDADIGSGTKQIELTVRDTESPSQAGFLRVNITPENDRPYFLNLGGARVINKSGIGLILFAADEETDLNYTFNISFRSCVHTSLNPPTGPNNCTLFNLTYYNATATNISFIPQGNQKGEYELNFSVTDFRNATSSTIVNWTVSWNDPPAFTYICNNERNTTENSAFTCYINVSDPDELNNLTFRTNYTWFTFNNSIQNITINTGSTGNASALVSFTPADLQVGNWSVNLTVIDTGASNASIESNSTTFYFFIRNVNDSVAISDIPNMTAYTSSTYNVSVNATDNDLLVPDKTVINETITFTTNNTNVAVLDQAYYSETNRSQAILYFNASILGVGLHSINVTVRDKDNNSIASDIFAINVVDNSAPQWNQTTATNFTLTEDREFYLNLSQNVTDTDDVNFSLTVLSSYGFDITINQDTGIINFTSTDDDVGFHQVRITATDGKTPSTKDFNFTVNNIPDAPTFFQLVVQNGTLSNGLINVTEDMPVRFYLQIADGDFHIEQTSFYSESLTLNLNITGPNSSLFQFGAGQAINPPSSNISQFISIFTPRKSDIGNYNLTINITDAAGNFTVIYFNLTVNETSHPPNITTEIGNRELSILNENFYIDVNATDVEDGSDGVGGNLTFRIQNLTAGGNFLQVNASTGIINFTTNSTFAGKWRFQFIVNDTDGGEDSEYFNLTIYDYPVILLPNSTFIFSLTENVTAVLNFTVNHSVQDSLNYTLIIGGVIKNSTTGYGNSTVFFWNFTSNFTMETTCSGAVNLILNVSNSKLSNSTSWLVNINHTNYPLSLTSNIPAQSGGTPLTLALSSYFFDVDASDTCLNQTVGFTYTRLNNSASGGAISIVIVNWSGNGTSPSATFSVEAAGSANFSITAFEYNLSNSSQTITNLTSNNFSVSLVVSATTSSEVSSSGGGGGSSKTQIVSLKILVPEPVSAKQKDKLIIPLRIENDGKTDLKKISLDAAIAKDGAIRSDLIASFDQSFFDELLIGAKENVTMIVDIDTSSIGLFEVTINATVEDPDYSDWAKFYIEIDEDRDVLEKIIFIEEFIIGNPQCAELIDLINDAKKLFDEGNSDEAVAKAENALKACNKAITQPPRPRIYERLGDKFIGYTAIASLFAFALGFAYYIYKKVSLNRKLNGLDGSVPTQLTNDPAYHPN